jgi:fucose permease
MDHSNRQSRRMLFYTLCLVYIGAGIVVILPGPTLPLLASHTGVRLDIAGWIFTASSLGLATGVVISGVLSNRVSAKYIMMGALFVTGIGALVVPWTHAFIVLLGAQFMLGIGLGAIDVGINVIVTLTFSDTLGETLNNLHSTFGIGALVGPLLLSLALQTLNEPTWAFAVSTFIALVAVALLARQHVPTVLRSSETPQTQQIAPVTHSVFKELVLWLMALQMFLYIGAELGFGNWITTAISQSTQVTLVIAAPAVTMFWIGLTGGRLLGAQILKRGILGENRLLIICSIGGGLSGFVVALVPGIIWLSFSLSVLVGLFLGPIFPSIMAIASRRFVHTPGTISSVMLFSAGASGLFLPVLVGVLITQIGIGWGMALPALCCLLIAVPFYFVTRRHTLPLEDDMHTMESKEARSTIAKP